MRERTGLGCLCMDVCSCVAGRPDQLDVVRRRQLEDEVHRSDHVALNAAMAGDDAELAIAISHVATCAAVVLAEPHVDVVNLRVGIAELNREREAVDPRMVNRDPAIGDHIDATVV